MLEQPEIHMEKKENLTLISCHTQKPILGDQMST